MGFRNPINTVSEVDTGGSGSRVVITSSGGAIGGGAVEVFPNAAAYQVPGALEAGADSFGPWTQLSSPPNGAGQRSLLVIRSDDHGTPQGVQLSSTGPIQLATAPGQPLKLNNVPVVGGGWITDVSYTGATITPPTGFTTEWDVFITVPAGRGLDVEWDCPKVTIGANGETAVQLLIAGAVVRAAEFSTGGGASLWTPAKLTGSYAPPSADTVVEVQVQARSTVGGGTLQAGLAPITLRHKFT